MAKTAELIELARKEQAEKEPRTAGGDLYCPACDVKPNARGIMDMPDGTVQHKPCGKLLDLVPEETATPAKKPRKTRKAAKAVSEPLAPPPALPLAPAPPTGPARLGEAIHELTRAFGSAKATRIPGGWLVEVFLAEA